MSINKPCIPRFDSAEWFYKSISFRSKATKKLDTDGGTDGATRLYSMSKSKSLIKQASSLVFIYQKIETKTIWSRTDPNLIPS